MATTPVDPDVILWLCQFEGFIMLHALRHLVLTGFLAAVSCSALCALPIPSPSMRLQNASVVVQARVLRVYENVDTTVQGQVVTHAIAELRVLEVIKGSDLYAGDDILIRYWWRRWLPGASPMPGNDGNFGAPAEGETLKVYLGGWGRNGYQVMLPYGFSK